LRATDCCLTRGEQFVSYTMVRTSFIAMKLITFNTGKRARSGNLSIF
jgi:hypothetical protein